MAVPPVAPVTPGAVAGAETGTEAKTETGTVAKVAVSTSSTVIVCSGIVHDGVVIRAGKEEPIAVSSVSPSATSTSGADTGGVAEAAVSTGSPVIVCSGVVREGVVIRFGEVEPITIAAVSTVPPGTTDVTTA